MLDVSVEPDFEVFEDVDKLERRTTRVNPDHPPLPTHMLDVSVEPDIEASKAPGKGQQHVPLASHAPDFEEFSRTDSSYGFDSNSKSE